MFLWSFNTKNWVFDYAKETSFFNCIVDRHCVRDTADITSDRHCVRDTTDIASDKFYWITGRKH